MVAGNGTNLNMAMRTIGGILGLGGLLDHRCAHVPCGEVAFTSLRRTQSDGSFTLESDGEFVAGEDFAFVPTWCEL